MMTHSIMGSSFLDHNTRSEAGEQRKYAVPESMVDLTKMAVVAMEEERIFPHLTRDETETSRIQETAFMQLFERSELVVLESAARALGNAGIRGHENQGALNFYGTAMAVVKHQHRQNKKKCSR